MKDRPDELLFPESEVRRMLFMILSGLSHIHNNKVVHRVLKPQNIMIDKNLNMKIIDFGMAKEIKKNSNIKMMIGSMAYMAPELFDLEGADLAYKEPIDVWAAGIIMYLLLCGECPF